MGVAGTGLMREIEEPVPEHLREFWTQDLWCLHSAPWLRKHWQRTGIMDIEVADAMPEGWRMWLDWQRAVAPANTKEIKTVEADAGRFLGYVRLVGRRRDGVKLEEYCWPDSTRALPLQYAKKPLLRTAALFSDDNRQELLPARVSRRRSAARASRLRQDR